MRRTLREVCSKLGPGLITGAADDDPSGIATYSQAGAQFGYNMLWALVFTYPLMVAIQLVSARIGLVTGRGLADNIRLHFPRPLVFGIVALLLVANMINIGADIAAMGDALGLVAGGPTHLYAIGFGVLCLALQINLSYQTYVRYLKWLTLALLAYVAMVFTIDVPWREVALKSLMPDLTWSRELLLLIVAVFGTTISPYLFFWQASQEVEELAACGMQPLKGQPIGATDSPARRALGRIRIDTWVGMGFSNLVALFIMLSTAATLHAHGVKDIQTSAQAAEALRPIAGQFAFALFALGIIGTGMLAVPVLAGSAAYAVAEVMGWERGLDRTLREARGFYGIIALATLGGVGLIFAKVDPIRALFWAAVINGTIAVPIMAVMMILAARKRVMGDYTVRPRLKWLGWIATAAMALAVGAMLVTL